MADVGISGMHAGRRYDVGGVLLDRPFRIRRLGHFGYNVDDVAACLEFYCEWLGLRVSDPQDLAANHPKRDALKALGDTNLYFIRHGTDHHSFVLFNRRVFNALGRADALPPRRHDRGKWPSPLGSPAQRWARQDTRWWASHSAEFST